MLPSKNSVELQQSIICLTLLRNKESDPSEYARQSNRAESSSDELHGSDSLSALEMAKDYSNPISAIQRPVPVHDAPQVVHIELITKKKPSNN